MSDEIKIDPGTIEEITTKTVSYEINHPKGNYLKRNDQKGKDQKGKYPKIEVDIGKKVEYMIKGLHTDRLKIYEENGKYIILDEEITTKNPDLLEKLKLIFSLLTHLFDGPYWKEHVSKSNYIKEEDEEIIKLRSLVEQYNDMLDQHKKIDGQVIEKSKEKRTIEATEENLTTLIKKIEEASANLNK